jgi:hypothetical protein
MPLSTIFRLSRWTALAAAALTVVAILMYPGGTRHDSHTSRYSPSRNFLSDLGMTVTHGGHANNAGAAVFTASFGLLALSVVGAALGAVTLHSAAPEARYLAAGGGIGVLAAGAGLLGAALNPADVSPVLHMRSAGLASAIAPPALLLFAAASARDRRLPRDISAAWIALTVIVSVWFAMRWAPGVDTRWGLAVHTTVQHGVAVAVVSALVYLTRRMAAFSRLHPIG